MNESAKRHGLRSTNFTNPHGLSDINNYSNAEEAAIISQCLLEIKGVKEIVNRKVYSTILNREKDNQRPATWTNTNKLLDKGFKGIKTGNTPGAKACLSSIWEDENIKTIIIVLGSTSQFSRFNDTVVIKDWCRDVYDFHRRKYNNFKRASTTNIETRINL
jgi:D-alanyl-D-alanine carboxypeptidase (penicillin-binding protein 5/6)